MVVVHVQGVTSNATDYGCVVMISDVGNINFGGCCSKLYQMNCAFWKVQNFLHQALVIKSKWDISKFWSKISGFDCISNKRDVTPW
jgi:hypothetical protein